MTAGCFRLIRVHIVVNLLKLKRMHLFDLQRMVNIPANLAKQYDWIHKKRLGLKQMNGLLL